MESPEFPELSPLPPPPSQEDLSFVGLQTSSLETFLPLHHRGGSISQLPAPSPTRLLQATKSMLLAQESGWQPRGAQGTLVWGCSNSVPLSCCVILNDSVDLSRSPFSH